MHNIEIRTRAMISGVRFYQIADACGLKESTFSRKLRKELPEKEKQKILALIDEIATGGGR